MDVPVPDTETALISAGVSAGVALTVSYLTRRSQERTAIDAKILKAIELGMSYPHVEDEGYCNAWNTPLREPGAEATAEEREKFEAEKDKRLQYDLYCCFVFNLIESIWRHCWRKSRVPKMLHVEEFIETHRCWWDSQKENLFGYDPKFQAYVQTVILDIRKREARQ
jgi:hypothetical protein